MDDKDERIVDIGERVKSIASSLAGMASGDCALLFSMLLAGFIIDTVPTDKRKDFISFFSLMVEREICWISDMNEKEDLR